MRQTSIQNVPMKIQDRYGIESMPDHPQRRIGFQALVQTFGTGLFVKACSVVVGILIARILGPTGRGAFETARLWPVFLASVGNMGIYTALKRLAAKEKDLAPVARSALLLSTGLSVLPVVCGYVLMGYLVPKAQHDLLPLATLFLLYIPAHHVALNLRALDEGSGHFGRYNLIRSMLNVIWLLVILILWMLGFTSVKWTLVALLFANFIIAAIRVIIVARSYNLLGKVYNPLNVLRNGLPFWLAGICDMTYERIDKILIMFMLGPKELGLYMVALAPVGLMQSTVMGSTSAVVFTMSAQSDDVTGFRRSAAVFRGTALMWMFGGVFLAVSMPFLVPFVYGIAFTEAILPAMILTAGTALAMQGRLLDVCLRGQGRPFGGVAGRLVSSLVLVILASGWVADHQLMGMAGAFTLSQAVYFGILLERIVRLHGRDAWANLLPGRRDVIDLCTRLYLLARGRRISGRYLRRTE